jgi:hypothetical protein
MIETNIDEIGEYLQERELYGVATMLKHRADETEGERSEPTTYLGMQVAAPVDRGAERPVVTGSTAVPVALPAGGPWAGDVVGIEPPLGFSIEEVGALGGAGGQYEPAACEIEAPAQVGGADRGER